MIYIKPIPELPGYFACSNGRILGKRGFLKGRSSSPGRYLQVSYYPARGQNKRLLYIHRLIASAFLDKVEGKSQVNHINGIKTDNRVENLEWVTPSENKKHAFRTGLSSQKGERNNAHKLTDADVLMIRELATDGKLSQSSIAKQFNISQSAVSFIKTGKRRR